MHADRVLDDGSWTRGKRPKARMALVTNKRVSTGSNSRSNVPRGEMELILLLPQGTACAVSARSDLAQGRRWASADLSRGPAYNSRPGLSSRQGPSRGPGLRQTCRAICVSRDHQTLRRLLSCLPASKPNSRFVLSASPCRPPREPTAPKRQTRRAGSLSYVSSLLLSCLPNSRTEP